LFFSLKAEKGDGPMNKEDFKRRLTVILSADVEGYSRLMGEDEDSTVRTLTAYRGLMSALIERYRGRVVDSPGDNLLAEFGSVMDAVRCAVEIQEELRIRNADLAEDRKMQFRIGINLGDVIEEGDRIYGDGINVAARVEGLSEGGGICISGTVYDSIRNKLSWSYDFLGEHNVKNIKEPVRTYRVRMEPEGSTAIEKEKKARLMTWQMAALSVVVIFILGAVAIWYFSFRQTPVVSDVEAAPKTIAVLPFENLSSDPEQTYFVDGLSEELLNSLCQIPDLGVAGKTSSFSFKGSNKTIKEIASILGVENILEGSVRKSGNALRITAQLVRAANGLHLWSKTYDRELKDIFAVQEDIATAVAEELKATLGIGKSFKQLGGTENVGAYELFLIAQGLIGQGSANDFTYTTLEQESIDAAIAIDPKFARAWVHKARIHNYWGLVKPANLTATERDIALSAVSRAIELEPNLAAGYYYLGSIKTESGDFIGGGLAIRKALELSTESFWETSMTAHGHYWPVGYLKRAHEIIEKSRRSDPLNHDNRECYISSLALLGDTQQAEEEYKRIRGLVGENQWDDMTITRVRLGTKDILSRDDIIYSDPIYDVAKKNLDSPKEGLSELRRLYANDDITTWDLTSISIWAAYFGDPEFAMKAMEKGVNVDASWIRFSWWPVMKEVRQMPRFKTLVKKIGLVDYWNKFGWPDLCHPVGDNDFVCE
jgi:adenylate cyclase